MKKVNLLILIVIASFITCIVAVGIGSVQIPPLEVLSVITEKYFGIVLVENVEDVTRAIVLDTRMPRIMLAFLSGIGLSVSGVLMQSVLRNPLASALTLGVSSGASLGASLAIMFGVTFLGVLTLPVFGLVGGLVTVFLALGVASKVDKNFQNTSIILMGTAFSLFANAMITIIMALSNENLSELVYWQMGSFAMRDRTYVYVLLPFVIVGVVLSLIYSHQLDILTLGDEQAQATGINAKRVKLGSLSLGAIVTGAIISVVGVIGFVDLFTPHVARKMFGASHKFVIPASAFLGGMFMVICDLIARTIAPPLEIPVGAITALIGAPFFMYLYFSKR